MNRRQNFQTISWFYDLYTRKRLNLNPPYQRRSVWNHKYKEYFIDTILLDYPAPAIFLYEEISDNGIATYNVVDGKQRLTSIFEFVQDEFPVSIDSERIEVREKYFSDLEQENKSLFWSYSFSVEYLASSESSVINNIFNRINKNVAKLTAQELRHAKYYGDFIKTVENYTDELFGLSKDFPRIAPKSAREMKDYEYVSQLFLLIENGPKGYSSDELDSEFSSRDEDWENKDRIVLRFKKILRCINEFIECDASQDLIKSRIRNQADFYSFFGAINALIDANYTFNYKNNLVKILSFINMVDNDIEREKQRNTNAQRYYDHIRTASNRTTARKERVEIIKRVISK